MRILVVIMSFYPEWGGTENQARRQALELVRRGHSVDVLTWRQDTSLPLHDHLDGITIVRTDRGTGTLWRRLRAVPRMLRLLARLAGRADVVVVHQVHGLAFLAGWATLATGRPIVVKPASTAGYQPSDMHRLTQPGLVGHLIRLAALPIRRWGIAVAMTDEIESDVTRAGFRRRVRIPNGIVVPEQAERVELRARLLAGLGLHADLPLVISSGRPDPVKGFDVLLSAWPDVIQACPTAQLVIIGAGSGGFGLDALCRRLGIEQSVHLLPPSPLTNDWVAAADVVAIPSRAEGMSNVLLEAMAAGTPVVSTAVSGAVDLIRDGENGRLVPLGDAGALARAIVETLREPGDMGRRARETILAHCQLAEVVDLYERTFRLARRLPPGTTTADMLFTYLPVSARRPADST